jgi:hypothetical protein
MNRPSINAQAIWQSSDAQECRKLYIQFVEHFAGRFNNIRVYYGWKRVPMLRALRAGRRSYLR